MRTKNCNTSVFPLCPYTNRSDVFMPGKFFSLLQWTGKQALLILSFRNSKVEEQPPSPPPKLQINQHNPKSWGSAVRVEVARITKLCSAR